MMTGSEHDGDRQMYKIPKRPNSKYEFVTLASKRAEQLQMGAQPKVDPASRRATVIAQEEVATGLVGVWEPEEELIEEDGEEE
jgi:DNA-directed RNA polymerase omega subunit